jgi:hypothetical protein
MSDETNRSPLLRRSLVLGGGGALLGGALAQEAVAPASAAPASATWKLGGNTDVSDDGSNFLGPRNVAPLIFKTKRTSATPLEERMRIAPSGRVGIGVKSPASQLEVSTKAAIAVRGTNKTTESSSSGVVGTADAGAGVRGNSANNYGVYGTGGYCGLRGQGNSYGAIVSGTSVGGYGSGSDYGLYGVGGPYGVYGTGSTYGVYGSGSTGTYGSGSTYGVVGKTTNPNSDAVRGDGGQWGVHGVNGRTAGIRGDSGYVGGWCEAPTYGLFANATGTTGTTYGLFGQAGANGWALYAQGNAVVTGTLSKAAGSFRIDHPLDPDNKWLSHSFVESPDMMNVYNGNVVLDDDGTATVELPSYFTALNRDFRYQLTPIGRHAPVYVASKIRDNRFRIAGGTAGLEVSWQVTGIRHDDYARAHPIVVEAPKNKADRGQRQFVPAGGAPKRLDRAPGARPHIAASDKRPPAPAPIPPIKNG